MPCSKFRGLTPAATRIVMGVAGAKKKPPRSAMSGAARFLGRMRPFPSRGLNNSLVPYFSPKINPCFRTVHTPALTGSVAGHGADLRTRGVCRSGLRATTGTRPKPGAQDASLKRGRRLLSRNRKVARDPARRASRRRGQGSGRSGVLIDLRLVRPPANPECRWRGDWSDYAFGGTAGLLLSDLGGVR